MVQVSCKSNTPFYGYLGFTLNYIEKDPDHGLIKREMRVQFDMIVTCKEAVLEKLDDMLKEARIVLSMVHLQMYQYDLNTC